MLFVDTEWTFSQSVARQFVANLISSIWAIASTHTECFSLSFAKYLVIGLRFNSPSLSWPVRF